MLPGAAAQLAAPIRRDSIRPGIGEAILGQVLQNQEFYRQEAFEKSYLVRVRLTFTSQRHHKCC